MTLSELQARELTFKARNDFFYYKSDVSEPTFLFRNYGGPISLIF